jgi:rhodanese-related sulfurtransferase
MQIEQLLPADAHAGMDGDADAVYLDVRTESEFAHGHPEGAINIPVAFQSPAGGMMPNPDFQAVVERVLNRETRIYCGCQSGIRSQYAAEMLDKAGYTNVVNVVGGFGGKVNPGTGMVEISGWRDSGLPVSTEVTGQNSYDGQKGR